MNSIAEVDGSPGQGELGTPFTNRRLAREWKTMVAMVRIYCRDLHHGDPESCADCRQFLDYAHTRLQRCRFGEEKPTCANCPVHCYQKSRRDQVRAIMRHAGPRMLIRHPILSAFHWIDGFRKAPSVGQPDSRPPAGNQAQRTF